MTVLLDGNALVALAVTDHVHHRAAAGWFAALPEAEMFATTPITQGTLLRLLIRNGVAAADALSLLEGFTAHPRHEFWPDDRGYDAMALRGVIGHRQVTDGYLAEQARRRSGAVVTFDRGMAVTHADVVCLIEP